MVEPHTPLQIAASNLLIELGTPDSDTPVWLARVDTRIRAVGQALNQEGVEIPNRLIDDHPRPHLELVT